MQKVEITVYKYDELDTEAQEKARDWFRDGRDFPWSGEYEKSLEAFESDFPVKVTDYQISPYSHSYIDFTFTDGDHEEMSGNKLRAHLLENYFSSLYEGKYFGKLVGTYPDGTKIEKSKEHPIGMRHVKRKSKVLFDEAMPTGFCADYDLRRPIYEFLKSKDNTKTFEELMKDCFDEFVKTWNSDMEAQDSDEYITKNIIANDYTFTSDGKIF